MAYNGVLSGQALTLVYYEKRCIPVLIFLLRFIAKIPSYMYYAVTTPPQGH